MSEELAIERGAVIFDLAVALVTFIVSFIVVGRESYLYFFFVSNKVKLFPRMVSWIASCEMVGSLIIIVGILTKRNEVCAIQSGSFQFFNRLSWNWTLMLSLQLDRVIVRKIAPIKEWQMHASAWILALFFEFVPFFVSDVQYGSDDDASTLLQQSDGKVDLKFICTGFAGNYVKVLQMTFAVFTGYLVIIIIILLVLNYRLYNFLKATKNEKILNVARMLRRYPLALCLFWLPTALTSSILAYCGDHQCEANLQKDKLAGWFIFSVGVSSFYGIGLAMIYTASYIRSMRRTEGQDPDSSNNKSQGHNFDDSIFRNMSSSTSIQNPILVEEASRQSTTSAGVNKVATPINNNRLLSLSGEPVGIDILRERSVDRIVGEGVDDFFNLLGTEYDESVEEEILSEATKSMSGLSNSKSGKVDTSNVSISAIEEGDDLSRLSVISMALLNQKQKEYSMSDEEDAST